MSDDECVAVHLMYEAAQGSEGSASPRWPHLAALPARHDCTVAWTDDQLAALRGSNLYELTLALRQQLQQDYRRLHQLLLGQHADVFSPPAAFTYDRFLWATCTLWTRAMDFQTTSSSAAFASAGLGGSSSASSSGLRCIVPVIDLCNTGPGARVCHMYDSSSKTIRLVAQASLEPGQQVLISYGERLPNHRLARLYGFVADVDAAAEVELYATMAPAAEAYEQKMALLTAAGLAPGGGGPNAPHVLTLAQPLPPTLLPLLRVQRLSADQVGRLLALPPATLRSKPPSSWLPPDRPAEVLVLQSLQTALSDMLARYPGSGGMAQTEDDARLKAKLAAEVAKDAAAAEFAQGGEGGEEAQERTDRRRLLMAVVVRQGERRVLAAALKQVEHRLEEY